MNNPHPSIPSDDELRYKLCQAVSIFPDELDDYLPNAIGRRQIEKIEEIAKEYAQKKYQEGELKGQKEALEAAIKLAPPDTNIVTTGAIKFMLDGVNERLESQYKERSRSE